MNAPESPSGSIWLNPKFYPSPRLRAFLGAIHEHPEMTLDEQAQEHGLSSSRFYHLLSKGQIRASRERMEQLMKQAAWMLYEGVSLKRVAGACGYLHVSDFCRAFKRYWRKAPCRWLRWARRVRDPNIIFVLPEHRLKVPRWAQGRDVWVVGRGGKLVFRPAENANRYPLTFPEGCVMLMTTRPIKGFQPKPQAWR